MTLRQLALAGLVGTLTGCGLATPPYPYWADVGQQWGCEPLSVQQQSREHARANRGSAGELDIRVGWDACEMLAKAGAPIDATGVFTTGRAAYSLLYANAEGGPPHRVTLVQDRQQMWRVSDVVW